MAGAGSPAVLRLSQCAGYWRTWTAATVSDFGSYMTALAIQVLIVETLHGSAADVGLVNAARWLPYLLFGLVVGALIERTRRRPVLVAADGARAVLLVAVPVLAALGHLHLGALVALMALFGSASLVGDAAFQAFIPRLVPIRLMTSAQARLDQSDAVAQTSGPALAGALVTLVGAPLAVLVDAVSYAASAVLLATVPAREPPGQPPSLRGIGRGAGEGLRWVYAHPTLRAQAISTHAWFVCNAMAGAVLTPFALRTLGLSAAQLGLALAVGGACGLAGASAAVRLGARLGAGRAIIACRVGDALAWAVIATSALAVATPGGAAAWRAWGVLAAGQGLLGLSMGASNANEMGYRTAVTPDRLQGRMNTTMRSLNRAVVVVAAPAGGLLGDAIGYRALLYLAAVGFAAGAAALAATPFRHAHLEDHHAQAVTMIDRPPAG